MSDVIAYRTLTRADFLAAQPPEHLAPYVDRAGAATCCQRVTEPGVQRAIQEIRSDDGTAHYEANIVDLRLRAQMDRKCSWWNPKDLGLPQDYILEHEQIHFALCELEARNMNASIEEIRAELRSTADTSEAAQSLVRQAYEQELRRRMDSPMSRNRDFDEDTSMGHEPEAQKKWWARMIGSSAARRSDASAGDGSSTSTSRSPSARDAAAERTSGASSGAPWSASGGDG